MKEKVIGGKSTLVRYWYFVPQRWMHERQTYPRWNLNSGSRESDRLLKSNLSYMHTAFQRYTDRQKQVVYCKSENFNEIPNKLKSVKNLDPKIAKL